jgi:hypothetical protein
MLQGNLEDTPITSVLQICNNESLTGVLSLNHGDENIGQIFFNGGSIVQAKTFFNSGLNALNELSIVKCGEFHIKKDNVNFDNEIKQDFNFLLLNIIKYSDEIQHKSSNISSEFHSMNIQVFYAPESLPLIKIVHDLGINCNNTSYSYIYLKKNNFLFYVKYDGMTVFGFKSLEPMVIDIITRKIAQVWK